MTIGEGAVAFVLIWWLVLFTVLPHGNRPAETVEKGHAPSAPANPRLWRKVLITTGISIVLFGVFLVIYDQDWISFRA